MRQKFLGAHASELPLSLQLIMNFKSLHNFVFPGQKYQTLSFLIKPIIDYIHIRQLEFAVISELVTN